MQVAKQLTPELHGIPAELQKQIDKGCVATSINVLLSTDPEIKSAFDKAACELMLDKIFNDLELKKDPEFKATPQEELAKIIA